MTMLAIILLITLGIALLMLEILFLPGFIAGILGVLFILAGIMLTYAEYGPATGHIVAIISVLVSTGLVIGFLRSKSWKRFSLNRQLEGKTNVVNELPIKPGDTGITLSALRPMGMVLINHHRVEAQSNGELIAENTPVRILSVLPNKVIVEPV